MDRIVHCVKSVCSVVHMAFLEEAAVLHLGTEDAKAVDCPGYALRA
jgi:hypothetical protein